MANVAIVSYDVQTILGKAGGVGAFTTRWANLLREAGESVTIVMTRSDWEPMAVDVNWRARYRASGISLIELQAPHALPTRWPEVAAMRMAEIAAPVLKGFDVIYVQDWGNSAFHLLRERRYSAEPGPVCVTVLHGPSEWELSSNGKYPDLPQDLHLSYVERYSARHSDFVVSPSRYMPGHLKRLGWEFPGEVEVLGLPMPEPANTKNDLPPSRIRRIVYFGRVEERKGIRNFVHALQRFVAESRERPEIVLLGAAADRRLLDFARVGIRAAGLKVSHQGSLDSDGAYKFLREKADETLCVIPSASDNFPYAVIEASLIPGLNVIACRGGGVPEILEGAEQQLCDPLPVDLADKIAERIRAPLPASELARYDCHAANEKWLEFHRKAVVSGSARKPRAVTGHRPSVDVCVTYFQKAPYLGQFMDALYQQTEPDFHVIAVNDGSPDAESNRVFEEHARKASSRGWDFYRQENAFVDAARNSAARRGKADLILFVDSDDVPARNAVARMREAIALSGDDALICASYLFAGEKRPFDPATGEVLVPAYATCIPLGMDLVGGLVDPSAFGGSMFIIRRSVFEKMGGFRELRGAGNEDWEFYVRLALAGYRIDVLPEFLQFYRQIEGGLARTLPPESSRRRLLDAYEDALTAAGLKGGALALAGLYRSGKEQERELQRLSAQAAAPRRQFAFFTRSANGFEPEPGALERLRLFYRAAVPLKLRLDFHRLFLAPFLGPYKPPSA
jgi:glycosyltransferase involved in cell wall biosynthesis